MTMLGGIGGFLVKKLKKISDFTLRLLFPGACPICDEVEEQTVTGDGVPRICPACEARVRRVRGPYCMRCGKPLAGADGRREYCGDCMKKEHKFVQGRAVFVYQGAIIGSMHRLKYSNRRDYATVFAREAFETYAPWLARVAPQAIIPVPLHPKRRKKRGYNQAALIAAEISRLTGIPLREDLLQRSRNTDPQKNLNHEERKNNLKNAFQIAKNIVQLDKVLLIDDIYTTGSTADAAAGALARAGVGQVYVLCICIGAGD